MQALQREINEPRERSNRQQTRIGELIDAREREREHERNALATAIERCRWLEARAVPEETQDAVVRGVLKGHRLLYVGGRPSSRQAIRDLATRHGAECRRHDGGLENGKATLSAGQRLRRHAAVSQARLTPERQFKRRHNANTTPTRPEAARASTLVRGPVQHRQQPLDVVPACLGRLHLDAPIDRHQLAPAGGQRAATARHTALA